ncbi:hypothetical protein PPERSA_03236 [Pseudocohnilembus persalinus]|uniref:Trimethylguanosine synthase n=1 Tax=Pseudocohnilembus persalinus TaxID=266149 RepID=A0A0V0QYQ4_PSEPJ|nr:hypothetical protein PPERSA_03236 [Pseudocohnilembus persalinus]|eukprot:KRX07403.1 hypothetical protein PPERSA_03236 [Pseudocohnilembus persalinus]
MSKHNKPKPLHHYSYNIDQYQKNKSFFLLGLNNKGTVLIKITEKNFCIDNLIKEPTKQQKDQLVRDAEKKALENYKKQLLIKNKNSGKFSQEQNLADLKINEKQILEEIKNSQEFTEKIRRIKWFYKKRYFLFSLFDQGCQLDEESWYSVVAEPISEYIAKRNKCNFVLDAFSGVGGLSIQFAKYSQNVWSNDIDREKIKMLKNNSKIYKVDDKITLFNEDFLQFRDDFEADIVILCPQWGGVFYTDGLYCLQKNIKPDFLQVLIKGLKISNNLILQLPKNINILEFISLISEALDQVDRPMYTMKVEIQIISLNNNPNQIVIYFGNSAQISQYQEILKIKEIFQNEYSVDDIKKELDSGNAHEIYKKIEQKLINQIKKQNINHTYQKLIDIQSEQKDFLENTEKIKKLYHFQGAVYTNEQDYIQAQQKHRQEIQRLKRQRNRQNRKSKSKQEIEDIIKQQNEQKLNQLEQQQEDDDDQEEQKKEDSQESIQNSSNDILQQSIEIN